MASFRKNFKPTVDEKIKSLLTVYDYIKENKTSCVDCENLKTEKMKRSGHITYDSICKISGECVLYPKYCKDYKFSDKLEQRIINCLKYILCEDKEKEHMKKISLEELKDKDLYLDDDGKIIAREKRKGRFLPKYDETYYYVINDFSVYSKTNYKSCFDVIIINKDYIFRTEEEAEEYAKYLKALEKYRYKFTNDEIKNIGINKYYVEYKIDTDRMVAYSYCYHVTNKILFKTKSDCENFIEEAGKENIKKFMFYM